jgi:Putative DNA-binding domain
VSTPVTDPNSRYLQDFESLASVRAATYQWAILSLVGIRVRDELHLLRGVVRYSRNGDIDAKDSTEGPRDYGALVFLRTILPVDDATRFVREACTTGTIAQVQGQTIRSGPFPAGYVVGGLPHPDWPDPIGSGRIFSWPSRDFTWSSGGPQDGNTLRDPYGILISPDHPPIIRPTQSIDDWTGLPFAGRMVPSTNLLFVVLPDFRVRIRTVLITDTGVDVQLEGDQAASSDLVFQATAGDRSREDPLEVRRVDSDTLTMAITRPSSAFHFFAVDRASGAVLDWVEFDVERPLPPQVQYESPGLRLAQLLEGGETQFIEWKGAVGDGIAIGEFFESVTGFANTNSGTIIVGVDDHGDVLGLGSQTPDQVKSRIVDLAETRCEPVPEGLKFQEVDYASKKVLLLEVPKGANPPYILRRDGPTSRTDIYVRRGDKDRPARRHELDSIYAARAPP